MDSGRPSAFVTPAALVLAGAWALASYLGEPYVFTLDTQGRITAAVHGVELFA